MIQLTHDSAPNILTSKKSNYIPSNINTPKRAWKNFRGRNGKNILRDKLLILQKGLCVYCEEKLDKYGFHIEHILSKTLNPYLTFEYSNLSLSCIENSTMSDETTDNPISCGHAPLKRENYYLELLFIKPTELNCASLFKYKKNGEITYNPQISDFDKIRVNHTIDVLNLNCLRLKRDRREIINKGYEIILDLKENSNALNDFLNLEFQLVNNKYMFPFISAREEHYNLFRDITNEPKI